MTDRTTPISRPWPNRRNDGGTLRRCGLVVAGLAAAVGLLAALPAPAAAEAPATAEAPHRSHGILAVLGGDRAPLTQRLIGEPVADRSLDVALSAVAGRIRGHIAFMRGQAVRDGGVPAHERRAGARGDSGSEAAPRVADARGLAVDAVSDAMLVRLLNRAFTVGLARAETCYERLLLSRPELAGSLSLQLVLDPAGRVDSVIVAASDIVRPQLTACVTDAVRRVRTARPLGDRVLVELPLVFARN